MFALRKAKLACDFSSLYLFLHIRLRYADERAKCSLKKSGAGAERRSLGFARDDNSIRCAFPKIVIPSEAEGPAFRARAALLEGTLRFTPLPILIENEESRCRSKEK